MPQPSFTTRPRVSRVLGGAFFGWTLLYFVGAMFMDRRFIFFPDKTLEATPAVAGLPYEDVHFKASDGTALHGWFIPAASPRTPGGGRPFTIVMFHGNAGNISHRIDWAQLYRDRLVVNVFLFDYRGYGRSEGAPSEKGTYLDGDAAVAAIAARDDVDPARIVLAGHSLGSAVAAEVALRKPPSGLVLESPFTSIADMAKRVLPFLPIGYLLSTRYETQKKIAKLACPVLVLHGDLDETIPFEHGIKVYEGAPEPRTFYRIRGAGHNDTYLMGGDPYVQAYARFLSLLDSRLPLKIASPGGPVPVGSK